MNSSLLAKEVVEDYEHNRTTLLASLGLTPEELRQASDAQLLSLQGQLLMGDTWGRWEFPERWGRGKGSTLGRRSFRLELALAPGVDPASEYAKRVWRELLRYTIALRLWPGPWALLSKPGTVRTMIGSAGRLIRLLGVSNEEPFWARIDQSVPLGKNGTERRTIVNSLVFYYKMGALPDRPAAMRLSGKQPRRDRTGEPELTAAPVSSKQWMPFPDSYTAAAGWRAVFMLRECGPTLIEALEHVTALPIRTLTIKGEPRPLAKGSVRPANKDRRDRAIAEWDWKSSKGEPLQTLPMAIDMQSEGRKRGKIAWPPTTYADAMRLLFLVQASHLWVVSLCLAGRHGELATMKVDCIRREDTPTPTGSFVTWKLEQDPGRETEAPLPDVCGFALEQQVRLAGLVKRIFGVENDSLWVRGGRGSGSGGDPLYVLEFILKLFNSAFGLASYMEDTNLHMHRFRKTLVRIVALALVHAPKILMDLLGHRDEQMTVMRYILSDPGIMAEIEEVTREMVILKGLDAVAGRERLQGKAAPIFRARVEQYAKLIGKNAFEPANLREFIEAITEGGTGWAIIGPGKVCTGFLKGGLCNQGTGEADPHYCTPECDNQLLFEEYEKSDGTIGSAVADSIETLDYMVDQLRRSISRGEEMLIVQFVGQVVGLLNHWSEVDTYFRDHHLVDPEIKNVFPKIVLLP